MAAQLSLVVGKTRTQYVEDVYRAWQRSVDSYLESGRLLTEAKANLAHGEFTAMIESDLPFSPRMTRMLMAVADDPVIGKGNHGSVLPPSLAEPGTLAGLGSRVQNAGKTIRAGRGHEYGCQLRLYHSGRWFGGMRACQPPDREHRRDGLAARGRRR